MDDISGAYGIFAKLYNKRLPHNSWSSFFMDSWSRTNILRRASVHLPSCRMLQERVCGVTVLPHGFRHTLCDHRRRRTMPRMWDVCCCVLYLCLLCGSYRCLRCFFYCIYCNTKNGKYQAETELNTVESYAVFRHRGHIQSNFAPKALKYKVAEEKMSPADDML